MHDSRARVGAVYRAVRAMFSSDWFRAGDIISAFEGAPEFRRVICAEMGAKVNVKAAGKWLARHREHTAGEYTLGALYSTHHETWVYRIEHADDSAPLRLKRPSRLILEEPAPAKPVSAPRMPPGPRLAPTVATEVANLVEAAAKQRERAPGGKEADESVAVPVPAPIAIDPAPAEVWTGPLESYEGATEAARRIQKHGLGAHSCIEEIEGRIFARSIGAAEAARTADAIRRIYKCRLTRVGLRNVAPTSEALRRRAAYAAQVSRQERQHEAVKPASRPARFSY
jgi:hypothetical protein